MATRMILPAIVLMLCGQWSGVSSLRGLPQRVICVRYCGVTLRRLDPAQQGVSATPLRCISEPARKANQTLTLLL